MKLLKIEHPQVNVVFQITDCFMSIIIYLLIFHFMVFIYLLFILPAVLFPSFFLAFWQVKTFKSMNITHAYWLAFQFMLNG